MTAGDDPGPPGPGAATLATLGERGLIARLRHRLPPPGPDVLRGIGDDAAVIDWDGRPLLATTDTLSEGVHFRRSPATLREIGAKALAVNISDLGAMGGEPRYALLALALPATLPVAEVTVRLAAVPVSPAARAAAALGVDVLRWALGGGEDYELLFTVSPDRASEIWRTVTARLGTPVHVIGEITSPGTPVRFLDAAGTAVAAPAGFDHFG